VLKDFVNLLLFLTFVFRRTNSRNPAFPHLLARVVHLAYVNLASRALVGQRETRDRFSVQPLHSLLQSSVQMKEKVADS